MSSFLLTAALRAAAPLETFRPRYSAEEAMRRANPAGRSLVDELKWVDRLVGRETRPHLLAY
jgi:hypothetical protein